MKPHTGHCLDKVHRRKGCVMWCHVSLINHGCLPWEGVTIHNVGDPRVRLISNSRTTGPFGVLHEWAIQV